MKRTLALVQNDPYLKPYEGALNERIDRFLRKKFELLKLPWDPEKEPSGDQGQSGLAAFATGHHYYGLQKEKGWVLREWAPGASEIYLLGDFSQWQPREEYRFRPAAAAGDWELNLSLNALNHGDLYKLLVRWPGGEGERLPAYAVRVVQDKATHLFNARFGIPLKTIAGKPPDRHHRNR